MNTTCTMKYDAETDRWYAITKRNEQFNMHCGDTFVMQLAKCKLQCRLEMDKNWYIICEIKRLQLHPKETYEIQIH